jgi:hypothetical protein
VYSPKIIPHIEGSDGKKEDVYHLSHGVSSSFALETMIGGASGGRVL